MITPRKSRVLEKMRRGQKTISYKINLCCPRAVEIAAKSDDQHQNKKSQQIILHFHIFSDSFFSKLFHFSSNCRNLLSDEFRRT